MTTHLAGDTNGLGPTITVGVDGTSAALAALRWAAAEASSRGARLRIVTAWDPSPVTPWNAPELAPWRDRARAEAEAAAASARSSVVGDVAIEAVAIEGSAGRVLVRLSHTSELLVVGSAGHLGLGGLLSGSVSRQCLHRACCPVVVVGPEAKPEPTQRLVLSSTLDPDGETYGWIAQWLRHRQLPVHVIGSFDFASDLPELALTDTQQRIRTAVRKQNAQWIWGLRNVIGDDIPVSSEIHEGQTVEVLAANTGPTDLLVVPAGCEHFAPFAHAGCPIAVVPAPHHAHPQEREFVMSPGGAASTAVR